jgi:membrane protein DedA with SNARE-associated domain
MNFGVRTILLLAAVVLFVIAVFSTENYSDLLALGLAAFAGAFLSDALGYADRTFGTTRRDTT